jgi:hypothetical protein
MERVNYKLFALNSDFLLQKQAMLVRQLEEELRMRMRNPSVEMQQQMEMLYTENEHLTREIAILRETIKVSLRFATSGNVNGVFSWDDSTQITDKCKCTCLM